MRKVAQYFRNLEKMIASQFDLSISQNSSDRGEDREDFLVGILNNHLPSVSRAHRGGIIMDHWDTTSRQTDIIIYSSHSPCLAQNKKPLFLAEGVFAAIEVKSILNSKGLSSALSWSRNLKRMQKFLCSKECGIYGRKDTSESICTGIFSYTSDIRSPEVVLKKLFDYHKSGVPNYEMLDFVCVNSKFCVFRQRTEHVKTFVTKEGRVKTKCRRRQCLYEVTDRQPFAMMLATILEYISYVGPTIHRFAEYLCPISTYKRNINWDV